MKCNSVQLSPFFLFGFETKEKVSLTVMLSFSGQMLKNKNHVGVGVVREEAEVVVFAPGVKPQWLPGPLAASERAVCVRACMRAANSSRASKCGMTASLTRPLCMDGSLEIPLIFSQCEAEW